MLCYVHDGWGEFNEKGQKGYIEHLLNDMKKCEDLVGGGKGGWVLFFFFGCCGSGR